MYGVDLKHAALKSIEMFGSIIAII
jgi:hypothetical protein